MTMTASGNCALPGGSRVASAELAQLGAGQRLAFAPGRPLVQQLLAFSQQAIAV